METKVDKILTKLDEHSVRLTSIEKDLSYHVRRTDELQSLAEEFKKYKWMVMGGIAVIGPAVSFLIKKFLE